MVPGGGLSGAADLILPALHAELNGRLEWLDGTPRGRLAVQVHDLERPAGVEALVRPVGRAVRVQGTDYSVSYEPEKRTGVGVSRLGASEAVALGAYAFALDQLDRSPAAPPRGGPAPERP